MAVREFNGTDDTIILGAGGLGAIPAGAWTFIVLAKPTDLAVVKAFISLYAGTACLASLCDAGNPNLGCYTDSNDSTAFVGMVTDEWQVVAVSKAAGNVAPRFHCAVLGAPDWSHSNGGGSMPDVATTALGVRLGSMFSFGNPAGFKATRMATAAVFDSALSDADIESIETTHTTQQLVDLGALAVWDLNQVSTGTAVIDLAGDADETSLVGTTVITGDDPGWTFGVASSGSTDDTFVRVSGAWIPSDKVTRVAGVWV